MEHGSKTTAFRLGECSMNAAAAGRPPRAAHELTPVERTAMLAVLTMWVQPPMAWWKNAASCALE
jgi:hypothetical protein